MRGDLQYGALTGLDLAVRSDLLSSNSLPGVRTGYYKEYLTCLIISVIPENEIISVIRDPLVFFRS